MKIAEIVCVFPPYRGGVGKTAYEQSRGLIESGEEVEVFTPDFGQEKITDEKFKVNYLKPVVKFGNAAFLPQLWWRLKKFDTAILHYPFFGTMEVLWLAKKLGIWRGKLFIYYHMDFWPTNLFFKIFSWPSRIIFKSLLKSADKIMVQSIDYTEHSVLKDFYLSHKDKFIEIAPGTELRQETTAVAGQARDKRQETRKKFILFVGGMDKAHYFKGVEVLLHAFDPVCHSDRSPSGSEGEVEESLILSTRERRRPARQDFVQAKSGGDPSISASPSVDGSAFAQDDKIKLFLVGDGELRVQYEKLARELGLEKKVKFLGKVNDEELNKLYNECEFLVLPSINSGEAFGLVLTEAMAAGKAVIASNLPGVRTVCQNGINGLLSSPGDAKDLAEKMKILLDNEALRRKFGEAGRRMVEERYNWEKHTKYILELLVRKS